MKCSNSQLIVAFNCAGHFLMHVMTALYLTLVLVLAPRWGHSYDYMIRLWTFGAFLVGAGAPLAGWLGDKAGEPQVMTLFFLGSGIGAILCGLASTPGALVCSLAVTGLFASIYHPVSLSWLTKQSLRQGHAIGFVGIFGTLGVASAALLAGFLTDTTGWRSAFIMPGVMSIAVGITLAMCIVRGRFAVSQIEVTRNPQTPCRAASSRGLVALAASMICGSVFYNSFVTVLPRWLSQATAEPGAISMVSVGTMVALTFLVGGLAQLPGGRLADRFPSRTLYLSTFLIQLAATAAAIWVTGPSVIVVSAILAILLDFRAPVESVLLARYSPGSRRGLAYGTKYAMGFIGAPLGVNLVAFVDKADGAENLFIVLSGLVAVMIVAATFIPKVEMDAKQEERKANETVYGSD